MSGFAGYTNYKHIYKENETTLKDMLRTIKHRGPDGKSEYNDSSVHIGVCHNNYGALISSHTMKIAHYVVAFDGILYNEEPLWNTLSETHLISQEKSIEALIINLYAQLGDNFVQHLNGLFALVIYNINDGSFFGARDRFGGKPLYYTSVGGDFVFASEIKAILQYPEYKPTVNETALKEYMSLGHHWCNETMFSKIFSVPPAHTMTYKNNQLRISRYWQPSYSTDDSKDIISTAGEFNTYLADAVKTTLPDSGNYGSILTNDIYSSYIAALSDADEGYSVYGDFDKHSSKEYASTLCNTLKLDNFTINISTGEYIESLSDIVYYLDEPIFNPTEILSYFLYKGASQRTNIALSCIGGAALTQSKEIGPRLRHIEKELRICDRLSMANSLEIRAPFLNNNFFDLACTIPDVYYTNTTKKGIITGKNVLHQAASKRLPTYFTEQIGPTRAIPMAVWLRNEKYYKLIKTALSSSAASRYLDQPRLLKALDAHKKYKADNSTYLWRAYIFVVWYEKFFN